MSRSCSLCDAEEASETFHVGAKCAVQLGLTPMPPPSRPPVPCTRCNGQRFIRVIPREYSSYGRQVNYQGGDVVKQIAVPMTLTNQPQVKDRAIRHGRDVEDINVFDGLGAVETYVCAGCGFMEWYCQNPQALPIGHEYNTEMIDYASETPYR